MRRAKVIAIKREIERVLTYVNMYEGIVQRHRVEMVNSPGDPVHEAALLQTMLNRQKSWKDALTRRVLQLSGIDSGDGIMSTASGRHDPEL